jgi:hypothetical protein
MDAVEMRSYSARNSIGGPSAGFRMVWSASTKAVQHRPIAAVL